MDPNQPWRAQTETLGAFIRAQRRLADLSLREMATLTHVSNAYLSQIERGLHQPSVRILGAIARALELPPDELLAQAGLGPTPGEVVLDPEDHGFVDSPERDGGPELATTETAILNDPRLTAEQRQALIEVYRSFAAKQG